MSYNKKSTKTSRESSGMGMKVLAFILAIVVIAGCTFGGLELWGKGKQKPSSWGKDDTAIVQPNDPDTDQDEEQQQPPHEDASESHGVRLMAAKIPIEMYESYGISPASVESAYTITATIEPDNATVKDVDWSVYFKNDASEWATDKTVTDYVTISPTAASCVVTCAQAFGEPIMVKVASHEDSSIFATKQFDYVKRIPQIDLSFWDGEDSHRVYGLIFGENNKIRLGPYNKVNTTGTIEGTIDITNLKYTFKDSKLLTDLKSSNIISQVNELLSDNIVDYNEDDYIVADPTKPGSVAIPWTAFFKTKNGSRIEEIGTKAINMLKSALKNAIDGCYYWTIGIKSYYTATLQYQNQIIETKEIEKIFAGIINNITVGITDLKFEDSGDLYF